MAITAAQVKELREMTDADLIISDDLVYMQAQTV